MELFTIGQMAEVNHVTKKTLMLYHKHGLLIPEEVDPQTGYRYYSLAQCSTLDMIQQLKQVGFSLSEIKRILDSHDIPLMKSLVAEKIQRFQREIETLQLAIATGHDFISTCNHYLSEPELEKITLEYLPNRPIYRYAVPPFPVPDYSKGESDMDRWEHILRDIKQRMLSDGLPPVLFHNVGCIVSKESLLDRSLICTGGFVFLPKRLDLCPADLQYGNDIWEGGWHLSTTVDRVFDHDGMHMEYKHIHRLLDAAAKEGYGIRGDYYCEILADTPAFFYQGRDMMMRMRLPVDISDPLHSPYYRAE